MAQFWQVTRSQQSHRTKKVSESLQRNVQISLQTRNSSISYLQDEHFEVAHVLHVEMSSHNMQAYFLQSSHRALWNLPSFCFLMLNLHLTLF
mmetsp:Transcript_23134/g.75285  ORF Transcript_23134/g.75285 Transcript_23134/m.75285 type:complete len:92 (-) Transcript_23134:152-427(-)